LRASQLDLKDAEGRRREEFDYAVTESNYLKIRGGVYTICQKAGH